MRCVSLFFSFCYSNMLICTLCSIKTRLLFFFFTIFIPNIKQMIGLVTGIMVLALAATGTTWKTGRGTVYMLRVTQDVSLERATRNYNWLPYLMVSKLTDFPNKRSLVQFENVPKSCSSSKIISAKMYLYYVYAHKASWHSIQKTPFVARYLQVWHINP